MTRRIPVLLALVVSALMTGACGYTSGKEEYAQGAPTAGRLGADNDVAESDRDAASRR